MKRFLVWLYLMSKRLLKKPSFVIILAMLPVVLLAYRFVITEDDEKLHAAFYIEGEGDVLTERLTEDLLGSDGVVAFYLCESEEELYNDVVAGRAECGYVFGENLLERFFDKDWRGVIRTIVSENSHYSAFVNEWVYAMLYSDMSEELTVDYMLNRSGVRMEKEEAEKLLRQMHAEAMKQAIVFDYSYVSLDGGGEVDETEEKTESHLTKPIRGTVALFVLLAGLAGLVFWYQDDEEGRFRVMAYNKRPLISFGSLLLPTLLAGIVGVVCLMISGISVGIFTEMWQMLWYVLLVAAFCNLLRHLIPSVNVVCAMIPIMAIVTYLCCPIIVDLGVLFPFLGMMRRILVADYYLEAFLKAPQWLLPAVSAGVLSVSLLFRERY